MANRTVEFFSRPGKGNTDATLQAVHAYLKESGTPAPAIVASISGRTALKAREAISEASIPILCVTGAPCWQNLPDMSFPLISEETREELQSAGVSIVDSVPSSLSDSYSLSAFNSSSSPLTLKIMLGVALVFVPIVILYQAWVYRLFRGPFTISTRQRRQAA